MRVRCAAAWPLRCLVLISTVWLDACILMPRSWDSNHTFPCFNSHSLIQSSVHLFQLVLFNSHARAARLHLVFCGGLSPHKTLQTICTPLLPCHSSSQHASPSPNSTLSQKRAPSTLHRYRKGYCSHLVCLFQRHSKDENDTWETAPKYEEGHDAVTQRKSRQSREKYSPIDESNPSVEVRYSDTSSRSKLCGEG